MTKKSKVVKNYFYNTAYEILKIFTPLITTPYISRVLGADGVGTFAYVQSISWFFVMIGSMGTMLYGQREIAFRQDDPEGRTRVFWEIEAFSFCTAVASTVVFFFIFGRSGNNALLYRIMVLEVLATAFDISWFFAGIENFRLTVIRNTCVKLLGIVLIFVLVRKPEDVPLYTLCSTLPTFLGSVSLWLGIRKYLVKLSHPVLAGIKKHIIPIILLFIPQAAIEVYVILDKTMIGALSADMSQVGYYTQAQKIIKLVLLIVSSLGTVMLPAMSAAFARGETKRIQAGIQKAFQFVFMMSFALLFGICAVAYRFVPLFFGKGFDLVAPLMIYISPIIVIIGISNVIGRQYLLPTKQQNTFTLSVVCGATVNFILNYLLIPRYNAIGATIATVVAELTVTGVQMWHVKNQLPLKKYFRFSIKYILMGIIMFLAVFGIGRFLPYKPVSLAIMVIVGVAVYFAELYVTRDEMLKIGLSFVRGRKTRENA